MDLEDGWTIYDSHVECLDSFRALITTINSLPSTDKADRILLSDFQENLDRYKVWASNVGAENTGDYWAMSLDFRLQEAGFLKSQVTRLIDNLSKTINKATSLLKGARIPFEEASPSPKFGDIAEPYPDTGSDTDSPWDISDDSRSESGEANRASGPSYHDSAPEDNRPSAGPAKTEMGQLLSSTKIIIVCLYKLPLRKPAPVDRIKGLKGRDMSLYQHFDTLYVRDKFPGASNYLVDRLGKLISRRRQLLEYRVTHTERLRPPVIRRTKNEAQHMTMDIPSAKMPKPGRLKSRTMESGSQVQSLDDLPSVITQATIQPAAEAVWDFDALYPPSVTESRISTASEYTESQELRLPPRPLSEDGKPLIQFECPYCGIVKHIPTEPARAWKSHVLRDLEPYVCTFKDCDMFDHMFESKEAWFNHESELHRVEWSCNACPSPLDSRRPHLTFVTQEGFFRHMKLIHSLARSKLSRSMEAFRHPISTVDGVCCLCGNYSKKLKSHLGRHMEQMALFALPRPPLEDCGDSEVAQADPSQQSFRSPSPESDHKSVTELDDLNSDRLIGDTVADDPLRNVTAAWLNESTPPPPPDPSSDPHLVQSDSATTEGYPADLFEMSPSAALNLLRLNLELIIEATGNAPVPAVPNSVVWPSITGVQGDKKVLIQQNLLKKQSKGKLPMSTVDTPIPSPPQEARTQEGNKETKSIRHQDSSSLPLPKEEPVPEIIATSADHSSLNLQHQSIVRKFFSKGEPPISVAKYLERLHTFCPMSAAVYLATSLYLHKLAVEEKYVSITPRTVHRLVLAGLRVSMKALEDLSYPHAKMAKVGGVTEGELARLEISFCFLTGFELCVNIDMLQSHAELVKSRADIADEARLSPRDQHFP